MFVITKKFKNMKQTFILYFFDTLHCISHSSYITFYIVYYSSWILCKYINTYKVIIISKVATYVKTFFPFIRTRFVTQFPFPAHFRYLPEFNITGWYLQFIFAIILKMIECFTWFDAFKNKLSTKGLMRQQ